jgi:DNA-binding transcriptional regulator YdaS (Cro superfamily)
VAALRAMDAQNHFVPRKFRYECDSLTLENCVPLTSQRSRCPCPFQILVHGTREATENLRRFCETKSGASVHTPDLNQWVDVSSAVGAYKVKLTEEMMSGVVFRKVRTRWPWHVLACVSFSGISGKHLSSSVLCPFCRLVFKKRSRVWISIWRP